MRSGNSLLLPLDIFAALTILPARLTRINSGGNQECRKNTGCPPEFTLSWVEGPAWPMGVFSDRTSVDRILYAVFSYENKQQGIATPFLVTQNS